MYHVLTMVPPRGTTPQRLLLVGMRFVGMGFFPERLMVMMMIDAAAAAAD